DSWKPLQTNRPTDADLVLWFGNRHRHNIALVTGAISRIVFVDTDSAAGEAWVEAHLPPTPLRTRTSRGHHYGYRHPGSRVPNRVQLADGVDISGDGGYVVAPGSRHRSGIYYVEVEPWPMSFDGLPVFPIEILATAVSATSQRIPALPSAISIGS